MIRSFSIKTLLITGVLILLSCRKDPPAYNNERSYFKNSVCSINPDSIITILTYNVQCGFRKDQNPWNVNETGATPQQIHDLAEIVRNVNPDIILLQEVTQNRSNNEIKNFLAVFADSLKMNFAYGNHGPNDAGKPYTGIWGNAILTKFPINTIENYMVLYKNKWSTRSVLKAEIQVSANQAINCYCLHHDGKDAEEMELTTQFIKQSPLPVLVGGDFNRRYDNEELKRLNQADFFGSRNIGIDRIYGGFNDEVLDLGSIFKSNVVSDHFACYARVKMSYKR